MIKTSLIISTYNWPEALRLCLNSIRYQKQLPAEVIIADDGSDDKTKRIIDAFRLQVPVPVKHMWQEDNGFRLAAIRNKAIAIAEGNYIIQVDGDIIMHPYFIKDHIDFAEKNSFVRASRIYIDAALTEKLLKGEKKGISIFNKGVTNITSALRLPFMWRFFESGYKNKGDERYEIHGCNMAFWKKDAVEVNGYNESFVGWGPEDKEFVARLLNAGLKKRFLKMGGIAFHLFHNENKKSRLLQNEQLLKKTVLTKTTYCSPGIDQYINHEKKPYHSAVDQHVQLAAGPQDGL